MGNTFKVTHTALLRFADEVASNSDNPPNYASIAVTPTKHLISFILVTLIILGIGIYYYISIRKLKGFSSLKGLPLMVFLYVQWIKDTANDILGPKYERFVPYFVYVITILVLSNFLSVVGFESIGTSLTVPLSLGIIAFLGTIISGIKFRKWSYINEFVTWLSYQGVRLFPIPDPMKWMGEISRLISISFRLWGNTLAGALILTLFYSAVGSLFEASKLNFLGAAVSGFVIVPFHFYFDILDGFIQPMIFMMLTMSYWAIGASMTEEEKYKVSVAKQVKKQVSSRSIIRELIKNTNNQIA